MEHNPKTPAILPFPSAEAAWFWTVGTLPHARIGHSVAAESARQTIADVMKCLDTLYRNRRIELLHVRILRIWGQRGTAPHPGRPRERSDWRLWREAMDRLDAALRARGLVEGSYFQDAAD